MRTFDKTDEFWKTTDERQELRKQNLLVLQKLAIKYPNGVYGRDLEKINAELKSLVKKED